MLRDDLIERLASAYFKLLTSLDWGDDLLIAGLREGLNKFLSNCHIKLLTGPTKWHKTDLITPEALAKLESGNRRDLKFEHIVPKTHYIQGPSEQAAREGTLSIEQVRDVLTRYWHLATVTAEEDARLDRLKMPTDWDGREVLARYASVGIVLQPNPYFVLAGIFTQPQA